MSDETQDRNRDDAPADGAPEAESAGDGTEERRSAREKMSSGIKEGLGVLSAFKDALEETISEARERGELSTERAKEVVKTALDRAQHAAGEAKERLDFVTQKEHERLERVVDEIRDRVSALESRFGGGASSWSESAAAPEAPPTDAKAADGEESKG